MKGIYRYLFVIMAIIITGCGTVNATGGNKTEVLSAEEQMARSYRDDGETEAAIEVYRQLIAANPKSFKSVLYQHEIMNITESTSDPWLLVDEMKQTAQLFNTACEENYEGATQEAVQRESEALGKYFYREIAVFATLANKTNNPLYSSFSEEIYNVYLTLPTSHTPTSHEEFCEVTYMHADMAFYGGKFEVSETGYTTYLNECEDEINTENKKYYLDAAHSAVLASDRIRRNYDDCPSPPFQDSDTEYQEYPIAECFMRFINASERYWNVAKSFGEQIEFSTNAIYMSAQIYFDHNHFDKAISLYRRVFQENPKAEIAVYAAAYIFDCYKAKKQYKKILDLIHEFRNNSEFMSNESSLLPEFIEYMNEFEKAILEHDKELQSESESK